MKISRANNKVTARKHTRVEINCPTCGNLYITTLEYPTLGCKKECSRVGKFRGERLREVVRLIKEKTEEKCKLAVDTPTPTP